MTRLTQTLCFTAFAIAAACSDTDTTELKEHAGSDPLYLAVTRVWNESETTSYLHVVSSLDEDTDVDSKQARELRSDRAGRAEAGAHRAWFPAEYRAREVS